MIDDSVHAEAEVLEDEHNVGVATDLESATVTEEDILEDIKVIKEEIKKIE